MSTLNTYEIEHTPVAQSPKIAYHTALSSWFFLPDGSLHQVSTCNTSALYDLVKLCTPSWAAEKQDSLMQTLDTDDLLGRWYAVNTLQESKGVYLPLFATIDAAASLYTFLTWCNSLPLLSQNRIIEPIEVIQENRLKSRKKQAKL